MFRWSNKKISFSFYIEKLLENQPYLHKWLSERSNNMKSSIFMFGIQLTGVSV